MQPALLARLRAAHGLVQRELEHMPSLEAAGHDGLRLRFSDGSPAAYDRMAVLFGFDRDGAAAALVETALREAGLPVPTHPGHGPAPSDAAGVFVAGDAAAHGHPCIQTALADGVRVAKAVQAWRRDGPGHHAAANAPVEHDPR